MISEYINTNVNINISADLKEDSFVQAAFLPHEFAEKLYEWIGASAKIEKPSGNASIEECIQMLEPLKEGALKGRLVESVLTERLTHFADLMNGCPKDDFLRQKLQDCIDVHKKEKSEFGIYDEQRKREVAELLKEAKEECKNGANGRKFLNAARLILKIPRDNKYEHVVSLCECMTKFHLNGMTNFFTLLDKSPSACVSRCLPKLANILDDWLLNAKTANDDIHFRQLIENFLYQAARVPQNHFATVIEVLLKAYKKVARHDESLKLMDTFVRLFGEQLKACQREDNVTVKLTRDWLRKLRQTAKASQAHRLESIIEVQNKYNEFYEFFCYKRNYAMDSTNKNPVQQAAAERFCDLFKKIDELPVGDDAIQDLFLEAIAEIATMTHEDQMLHVKLESDVFMKLRISHVPRCANAFLGASGSWSDGVLVECLPKLYDGLKKCLSMPQLKDEVRDLFPRLIEASKGARRQTERNLFLNALTRAALFIHSGAEDAANLLAELGNFAAFVHPNEMK